MADASAVTTQRRRSVGSILLFIAGFGAVFTALGAFSTALVPILKSTVGLRLAGVVVALFGAALLLYGLRLGSPGLYAEHRPFLDKVRPGRAWAFPLGMAFAAGWTPCIGPVLGAIFTLAAAQGGAVRGMFLMAAYSVGLGLPFLLVGVGLTRIMEALSVVKRNYRWIAVSSGGLMLAIGALMVTGAWVTLLNPVLQWVGRFTPAL